MATMRSLYPQLDLGGAIRYLERNDEAVLRSGVYKRGNLLPLLKFSRKSGPGQSAIVSLIHYGFIERNASDGYYFTRLAKRFAKNEMDSESRQEALKEALKHQPLFKELEDAKASNSTHLAREIIDKYGIAREKFDQVMAIYKKSRDLAYGTQELLENDDSTREDKAGLKSPDDSVLVNFGDGMMVTVPKRIILEAYLNELQKIHKKLS